MDTSLPYPMVDHEGCTRWYLGTVIHQSHDQPAIIYPDVYEQWWTHGLIHRNDAPAVIVYGFDTNSDLDTSYYWFNQGFRYNPKCTKI